MATFIGYISYYIKHLNSGADFELRAFIVKELKTNNFKKASDKNLRNAAFSLYYSHFLSMEICMDAINLNKSTKQFKEALEGAEEYRKKFDIPSIPVIFYLESGEVTSHMTQFQESSDILDKFLSPGSSSTKTSKKSSTKAKASKTSKVVKTVKPPKTSKVSKLVKSPKKLDKDKSPVKKSKVSEKKSSDTVYLVSNYTKYSHVFLGNTKPYRTSVFKKAGKSVYTVTKSLGPGWVLKVSDNDALSETKALLKDEGAKVIEISKDEYEELHSKSEEKSSGEPKKASEKKPTSSLPNKYTVADLRKMAKEKNISGYSKMKKDDLCKALKIKC